MTAAETAVLPGLILQDIVAGYRGRPVIDGLSIEPVAPGRLVALLGPNAVGKSTLLRALAGLGSVSGRIVLDGRELTRLPRAARFGLVGYLPQSLPQPTSLLAWEAVASAYSATAPHGFGPAGGAADDAIESVFGELGIAGLALRRLDQLSGGQRQMVGLAQLLVRRPRLMLLDEPTSALDLRWQLRVLETVRGVARRTGAVAMMAAHDLNLALRFCDRVVVLSRQGVVADGPPLEAMTTGVLRAAFGVEARVERCSAGHPVIIADHAMDD